jgi:hypothetical protein
MPATRAENMLPPINAHTLSASCLELTISPGLQGSVVFVLSVALPWLMMVLSSATTGLPSSKAFCTSGWIWMKFVGILTACRAALL